MMKQLLLSAYIVISVLLLSACGGGSKTSSLSEGDTLQLKYAENLCLVRYADYTVATLKDPWNKPNLLHTYILVNKHKPIPEHLPEGTVVKVPLEQSMVYSSVHCNLFKQLGSLGAIAGVCGLQYIKMPEIQEGCRNGSITDCGNSMNPDIEKIIDIHPDAILLSPFENSGGYGRIGKLNVPIVECADYMETSPLGRAEWMHFYGLLTGHEAQADSLFRQVERAYLSIREKALQTTGRPTVLSDLKYGSAWYIAGGKSTTGQLYADAGARYVFANLPNSGSVPLSFEAVFDQGQNADFWFIKYNQAVDKTYHELAKDYAPYANFAAFRNKRIYGCNTNRIPYYEDLPFRPDLLLKDMVKILHPEVFPADSLKYFTNLAD